MVPLERYTSKDVVRYLLLFMFYARLSTICITLILAVTFQVDLAASNFINEEIEAKL